MYAHRKYGKRFQLPDDPEHPVSLFATRAVFLRSGHPPVTINGFGDGQEGRDTGRRVMDDLKQQAVRDMIDQASRFLGRQVDDQGQFVYGIFPCFDRQIDAYNTLRHTSTIYSMLEAWEVTRHPGLKASIDRAIAYLKKKLLRNYVLPSGETVTYLRDTNNEVKLGGSAVCLLALVKYTELTEDKRYYPLLERLALGVLRLQDQETGQFTHVLNADDLTVKEHFRIIYYDGEAAFGLMRLYGLTKDPRWLEAVERAFEYFIEQNHWKVHDHWLGYCVNEL
ncbi:MAG: glutamate ligase, partial [Pseudomonadales bacterium]